MQARTKNRQNTPEAQPDAARWRAVLQRDARADGLFYYAVASTGVYCRPSCPSRRPRRERVSFFATRDEAERAGFRPCRRCQPQEPSLRQRRALAVARACRLVDTAEEPPALHALAATAGMSRFHFHRVFTEVTGMTPRAYVAAHRASRLREQLTAGASVTDAMYNAGFTSNGRFYEAAPGALGMTPTAYRTGAAGERIRVAIRKCFLGLVLVAATDRGICAVCLGDDRNALGRELRDRFPRATLLEEDESLSSLVSAVVSCIESSDSAAHLPLDIRGTAFQHRVWKALQQVPPGSTVSYAEMARRIGAPASAARAVARACATNPVAVVVPCHRVVGRDGSLTGYRWGLDRKRRLIEREHGKDARARRT